MEFAPSQDIKAPLPPRHYGRHCAHSEGGIATSALMRALHDFHGILHVAPLVCFFHLTFLLACQCILSGMSDCHRTVPIKHLPGDGVDLSFGHHLLSPDFHESRRTGPAVTEPARCL
jgi:hypothetical protein